MPYLWAASGSRSGTTPSCLAVHCYNQPAPALLNVWLCCACVAHLHWSHTRLLQTGSEAPTSVSAVLHDLVSGQIRHTWQRMCLATRQVFQCHDHRRLEEAETHTGDHRSQAAIAFCRQTRLARQCLASQLSDILLLLRSAFKKKFLLRFLAKYWTNAGQMPADLGDKSSMQWLARQMSASAKTV